MHLKAEPDAIKESIGDVSPLEYGPSQDVRTEVNIDPTIEKRLRRKADMVLIPILAITYLFKYVFQSLFRAHFADMGLR